ncbi:peptidase S8/S53 domain-containing protein, partial [Thamnocephalis sphaerospora]
LINGISLAVDDGYLDTVRQMTQVRHVWPLSVVVRPSVQRVNSRTMVPSPAHAAIGVDQLRKQHRLDGHGIKVGIIDSGIDYRHPALDGCFGQSCRVAYGWDFVGDAFTGHNTPVPDADPRDTCNGHGTHVAGIVGASSAVRSGIATGVLFGAYRIFGCRGHGRSDVTLAAMEYAAMDSMDIVNLSFANSNGWPWSLHAAAADRLTARGIAVVAAIGNSGMHGMWATATPAIASSAIAVAAVDVSTASSHMAKYSSWGPGPHLEMKPDIAAPGSIIHSTWPVTMGSYAAMTGTSMAAPHVTGTIALLLQADGGRHVDIRQLKARLQTTARPIAEPGDGMRVASVSHQGAGLLNAERAYAGTFRVSPSQFPLNDTRFGRRRHFGTV